MGTLYGVSMGPGDPKLLTLQAVEQIQHCPVLAAPENGTAFAIARKADLLDHKQLLPLHFPMHTDDLSAAHQAAADKLCEALQQTDAAFLCLGDISLYASFPPVAALVRQQGFPVECSAGVPSFCAAAAKAGLPLVSGTQCLHILPYSDALPEQLSLPGSKVILKCGRHLEKIQALLSHAGLAGTAYAVENCGMDGERLFPLSEECPADCGYFTIVCIPER